MRYQSNRHALSPSPSHQDFSAHPLVSITQGHVAGTSLPGRKGIGRYNEVEGEDDLEGAPRDLHSLPTDFCDWCCKYFANPLTKVT